jgi:hypothetical protein
MIEAQDSDAVQAISAPEFGASGKTTAVDGLATAITLDFAGDSSDSTGVSATPQSDISLRAHRWAYYE